MSLESPAAGRSFAPRVLVAGEYTALVMTFLALFGCLAALFVYTGNSLSQGAAVRIPEPDLTGKREDNYAQLSYFTTRETYRRQAQEQYRAAVTQAVAYLAGAAVAFLAVGLFLRAARAPLTTPVTVWDRLGQFARRWSPWSAPRSSSSSPWYVPPSRVLSHLLTGTPSLPCRRPPACCEGARREARSWD